MLSLRFWPTNNTKHGVSKQARLFERLSATAKGTQRNDRQLRACSSYCAAILQTTQLTIQNKVTPEMQKQTFFLRCHICTNN